MNGRICTTLAVGLFLAELDGPVEVAGASCEGVSFHIQQLNASDAATGDHFGWALAMQDATLLVASPEADSPSPTLGTGAAYVFQLNGTAWSQAARLTASDRAVDDEYGGRVAMSGDTIAVGARQDNDHGDDSGSVYVYSRPPGGWSTATETLKLTASDGAAGDVFGGAVALSSDLLIVGAFNDDDRGADSGSAYLFVRSDISWTNATEVAKLNAGDGSAGDRFGVAVAGDGDLVVIGADQTSNGGPGTTYIFERFGTDWVQTAKLSASDGRSQDRFGFAVAVRGDVIAVGAFLADASGLDSGAAYLFVRPSTGWTNMTETAKLTASDGAANDMLGVSLDFNDDQVVAVGTHAHRSQSSNPGAAYLYVRPHNGWASTVENLIARAPNGQPGDQFGTSIGMSDGKLAVGANAVANFTGAAYVFGVDGDCDASGELDACEVLEDPSLDNDQNGVLDVCEVISVLIDIKPGSATNSIQLGSRGLVPVAILTTEEFDAAEVDPDTVQLAGSSVAIRGNGSRLLASLIDVDGDGDLDLMLHVSTENLALDTGATLATLTGETWDGESIEGSDTVNIVPP